MPLMKALGRVLVANRGEIAVRVLTACREAGVPAAAVYSAADRGALHVRRAERAREIGPAPARESYLDIERILAAARQMGAGSVHPGYGFLAENAEFAAAVQAAGLVWIGPPPAAIRAMGEKTAARRTVEAVGVAVVPGTVEPARDPEAASRAAAEVGYPLLLKAAAGGGGKGMRVVTQPGELAAAFAAASREAAAAFGDPALYLERYLADARHVEIQILADGSGRAIHLGERECSLQRRHQKVLEEAPAPGLDPGTRSRMGAVAVRAAEAVGYVGAGTVEFLLAPDGSFWFLEMNTRLQVEHPVTELVTGIDIVRAQLSIACGGPLPLAQEELRLRGHAIECRIAAEDADRGFLPATGRIRGYREPGGPGVRVDSGIEAGSEITPHYDPLLLKLVVHAEDREAALGRMERALADLEIDGVTTNAGFQRALVAHPAVREGSVHTRWLEEHAAEIVDAAAARRRESEPLAAAIAAWRVAERGAAGVPATIPPARSDAGRWREAARWTGLR
ncbi:MAG TPA: acetyl-CoA carboxylase biotin carboxylase subunit [Gemmatimonadota bacterium]|nr:acetyl-CoA carboxylase biotin carboxylase subunit [Gemmatimonadota bacterium]